MLDSISGNWVIEIIMIMELSCGKRKLISIFESSIDGDDHLLSSDGSKEI